jgi:hypothetical protein
VPSPSSQLALPVVGALGTTTLNPIESLEPSGWSVPANVAG